MVMNSIMYEFIIGNNVLIHIMVIRFVNVFIKDNGFRKTIISMYVLCIYAYSLAY